MPTHKLTKGQQAVIEILEGSPRPLCAQEIYLELRGTEHEVGLATVYRSLETLQANARIRPIDVGGNQSHYLLIGKESHSKHHLICLSCKQIVPLDHCPVLDLETHLSEDHQFAIEYHVLDFYGTCGECR